VSQAACFLQQLRATGQGQSSSGTMPLGRMPWGRMYVSGAFGGARLVLRLSAVRVVHVDKCALHLVKRFHLAPMPAGQLIPLAVLLLSHRRRLPSARARVRERADRSAGGRAGPRAPRLVLQHERDVMACQPRTPWLQLPESARKCLAQAQARAVPTWRSSSSAGAHSRARSSPPAGAPAAQQRSGQARPGRGAYLYCQTCCSCRTRVGAERAPGGRGARTSISTRYRAPQWYARITSTVSCRPATGRLACAARARSTGASQLEGG